MGRHSSDSVDFEEDDTSQESEETSSEEEKKSRRKKHSSHKKKKKSKDKKHKKKSKKHRRRDSTSESEDSGSEDEWVVKGDAQTAKKLLPERPSEVEIEEASAGSSKKPKLDDALKRPADDADEWDSFGSSFQTFSNDSKRTERRKQKEREREENSIDKLGQHVNELNPYWKDGGTGLPSEKDTKSKEESSSKIIGDGGVSFLRKAFIRAKEQAKEEGRTLEEVVSERWGSLEKFLGMLEEAEEKAKELQRREHDDRDRGSRRFARPRRDSDDDDDYHRGSSHHKSHNRDRDRDRHRRRSRSRDRDSRSGWRKKRDSPEPREKPSSSSKHNYRDSERRRRSPTPPPEKSSTSSMNRAPAMSYSASQSKQTRGPSPRRSPSASDSDTEADTPVPAKEVPKVLTDKEMNELNAKLMKAEMLGNDEQVQELKTKISAAEAARQDFIKNGGDLSQSQNRPTKVVTKVMMEEPQGGRRRKDKIMETHKDGQRVRYFPDDDKYTLKNMFQKEKLNTAADENALFARLAGKGAKTGMDYDADDVFTDRASSSKQARKEEEREVRDALDKEKEYKKVLDTCQWCFDGSAVEKHLILSVGEKSYLCVPPYQSMTEGHCLIVPMSHVSSAVELDEDVWAEMQKFRKALVRMFREEDQDMVIFETALFLKRHPHMYLEVIPMPKETGELAPIYFKKAIQECETEWSQNKKLVDLKNRDVRKAVPKGLPYFSVDFGDDNCGFAHVIEDERNFPRNFAHEIVGGMMELDHHLWRKQRKDDFRTQRNKVMEFLKLWGPHDWTREAN